ncbi:bifunctional glycosyltransferase family 2/GtrA family protein [uncultured Desulfosarcina sp.]|uniref:bifunctional glycosyltransferase family 2/GtrA family protein n=1 Tax=uncultured Desulfosarcina sp. TaxID=218289 RepID=UPI0029C660A0|nr:bifunctional glycosyltransferase family 2/GtrA family protein [uncultured Desulfosarcina sp.]
MNTSASATRPLEAVENNSLPHSSALCSIGEKAQAGVVRLSIVIPCYNETATLTKCVERVLEIASDRLLLDIVIVDDGSTDGSLALAVGIAEANPGMVRVFGHECNQGKGAALQTGFSHANGDYVAVQDADLEYDPNDLIRLLGPLVAGHADVVIGSRFLSSGAHRVLYYWHSVGNKFLTTISNMFTDLNLTDMESCYKVFRREVLQQVTIKEKRFGFEPEIVAKVAHLGARVYEMGISYHGRTYEEGKKIGAKDGLRALYCIFRYNAYRVPLPVQFVIYLFIGGTAAMVNLLAFLGLIGLGLPVPGAAPSAFLLAATTNYILCILLLFRHKARWNSAMEILLYCLLVVFMAGVDLKITQACLMMGASAAAAKLTATAIGLVLNFVGRRFLIFPEKGGNSQIFK